MGGPVSMVYTSYDVFHMTYFCASRCLLGSWWGCSQL